MGYWCKKVKVGDVVMSPEFVNGRVDAHGTLTVGHDTDITNLNPTRAGAKYVVEAAFFEEGKGWRAVARRLAGDTYEPGGEVIHFHQGMDISSAIESVEVVGHMTPAFGSLFSAKPHDCGHPVTCC